MMSFEPIVCRRCAIISRGIVGNCSHVLALIAAERERCAKIAADIAVYRQQVGASCCEEIATEIERRIRES